MSTKNLSWQDVPIALSILAYSKFQLSIYGINCTSDTIFFMHIIIIFLPLKNPTWYIILASKQDFQTAAGCIYAHFGNFCAKNIFVLRKYINCIILSSSSLIYVYLQLIAFKLFSTIGSSQCLLNTYLDTLRPHGNF